MKADKAASTEQQSFPENGNAIEVHREVAALAPTPTSILELAVKQGANIETLERLLGLQERFMAAEARRSFEEAFAEFKKEAPILARTKGVSFGQGKPEAYRYTPLDQIANAVGPILAKHRFSYNWKQESSKDGITVTCILHHAQGHAIENTLSAQADPSGSKNAIQAIGSAVSYLRRYTLLGVLGMATGDEDTDGITMGNATDFLSNMEAASSTEELERAAKEAMGAAYRAKDPKAAQVFMEARKRFEAKLRGAA